MLLALNYPRNGLAWKLYCRGLQLTIPEGRLGRVVDPRDRTPVEGVPVKVMARGTTRGL